MDAVKEYKSKGGEEARQYLYQREYDRLDWLENLDIF